MPSTYTVNLGIEKPATGEQSGTWGDTTNVNFDILDQAVNGAARVTLTSAASSGSPNTLAITNGATSDGRNKWVEFYSSSDLGGNVFVQLDPNDAEKIVFVRNSLGGSQSLILFQGTYNAGRDLEIPAGMDMVVKFDGGGATATTTNVFQQLRTEALNIAGDGATVTGIKDEDNMASNSATKLATQQSIKAYVDSQVGTVDTLAEILANGNTTGGTNIVVSVDDVISMDNGTNLLPSLTTTGDLNTGLYFPAADQVGITTGGTQRVKVDSTGVDVTGTVDISGAVDMAGTLQVDGAITTNGNISVVQATPTITLTDTDQNTDTLIFSDGGTGKGSLFLSADHNDERADTTVTLRVDGSDIFIASGTGAQVAAGVLSVPDGSASSPSITNTGDGNTGIFFPAADQIGFSAGGTEYVQLGSFGVAADQFTNKTAGGDVTIDAAADIVLDADGGDIRFKDGGVAIAVLGNSSSDFFIGTSVQDKDILFKGNDGGSTITALTLDMSEAGAATFNGRITADAGIDIDNIIIDGSTITSNTHLNLDIVGDLRIDVDGAEVKLADGGTEFGMLYNNSNDFAIYSSVSDGDLLFQGNDNGSTITALTLDMSEAGSATFNHDVFLPSAGNLSFTSGGFNPKISNSNSDTALSFFTNNTERFQIATDGGLHVLTPGTSNVRLGVNAGDSIASGTNYNVIIGDEAGTDLNSGDENVAVGYKALHEASSGSFNTAIGSSALRDLTTGSLNIAIGINAAFNGTVTGDSNIAMSYLALQNLTGGIGNIAIGRAALSTLTVGNNSIAIGYEALAVNNNSEVTSVGNFSGLNSTGAEQVFVGYSAGKFVTTGTSQTFVGHNAGKGITGAKLTGSNNTAIGKSAGLLLQGAGYNNTFVGKGSGQGVTTGINNTAMGVDAQLTNSTGGNNVGVGREALKRLTTSSENVAVGSESLKETTTGNSCTAIGHMSGQYNETGDGNTFLGHKAGQGSSSTKLTGNENTAVGRNAGLVLQGAAVGNQCFGTFSGDQITTGDYNVCIGYDVGSSVQNLSTGNRNILIGYKTSGPTSTDNAIGIGDQVTVVANDFSFGKASNIVTNDFDADANWSRSSDERLKKNITNQTLGLDFINDLRTVKYNWKPSDELDANDAQLAHLRREDEDGNIINDMNTDVVMHNFIAQEVKAALDAAGVSEFGGWKEDQFGVQQVSREMFVIPLVKAVQELSTALDAALARIAVLEG